MVMDDNLARTRPKSTLLDHPGKAAARPPEHAAADDSGVEEKPTPLPQAGDPYDTAYSRPANKPVPTLRFVMGDHSVRGLPYASYDSIDWLPSGPGHGPSIVLRFTGIVPREAIIEGRHLPLLYDLLAWHRIAWVRELPGGKDFQDGKATVITRLTVNRITEAPA